jgi:hypothetical protein
LAAAARVNVLAIVALALSGRQAAAHEVAAILPNLALLFKGLIKDPA